MHTTSKRMIIRRGLYAEEDAVADWGVQQGAGNTQKINTVLVNAQDVTTAAVIFE